ncbi:TetR/AcrR family transcriptional regulator [Streptomyces albicerus]|uniref:TetR/AcrR family transcriptional regulator n=1 Tax=Streptomyces albicerus TaxID=2569859 RepID=UPI00124B5468|nr:TetR/AcrR family transcriptional regulator [Streptomyces albicerus]
MATSGNAGKARASGSGTRQPAAAQRPLPAPTRTRTRKPVAERRLEILAAAATLIGSRGFNGLAIQDVAEACDLTVAGLLHHFPSKAALLVGVLEDRDRRDLEYATGLSPADRQDPVRVIDALVEHNARQPEVVRLYAVLGAEATDPGHPAHAYFRDRYDRGVEFVRDLLAGHVEDVDRTARQVIAMMDGLQLQWLYAPGDFDLVQVWRTCSAAFLPSRAGANHGQAPSDSATGEVRT